jgi:hypothetical protein
VALATFEDDETAPLPCRCAACLARERHSRLVAEACIQRVTSIHSPFGPGDRWTVYLLRDNRVCAFATGPTEELAIDEALRTIGVLW